MIVLNAVPVNQPTGTASYGPVPVDDTANYVEWQLKRNTVATPQFWPLDTTTLEIRLFCSPDLVNPIYTAGAKGGSAPARVGGGESPQSSGRVNLPKRSSRQLTAKVTVVNGPLVSELTLLVE